MSEAGEILDILSKLKKNYPELRLTQLMYNLDINQDHHILAEAIKNKEHNPPFNTWRDNYNDSDKEVLNRIKKSKLYIKTFSIKPEKPDFSKVRTCKGSIKLGNGCGTCPKCEWESNNI